MTPLDIGQTVRQAVRPIEGEIIEATYHGKGKTFAYLVAYTDEHGHPATRWFNHDDIEPVADVAPTKTGAEA